MRDQGSGFGDQGSGAPRKKAKWIPIVLGILVLLFFVAVGGIIFTVSFFRQNLQISENIAEGNAASEFEAIYAKFPGRKPLIQLVDGRPQYVDDRTSRSASTQPLNTLHVIAFDRGDEEMAKFSLPFWLLRLKSGPIRLSAYSQGWDDRGVSFDVKDLEAAGPGIVVDVDRERDGRMLIWVE
jgi:hypothetical protein